MAIPFYVLAGNLMSEGGLTQKIVSFANALVGHVRGGLAHVSIVSAAIFSGVSGSAAADTAAIGSIMIPAMKKEGYASDFSVCVVASACTMGPIIPPSILFIVYGSLVQVSVGQLFLAGFLPGRDHDADAHGLRRRHRAAAGLRGVARPVPASGGRWRPWSGRAGRSSCP